MKYKILYSLLGLLFVLGCDKFRGGTDFSIDYEKYTLDNGLEIILHEDHSDPITAVAVQYHVGSNREEPGKTGFAHLFEHMLFQESENVGQDQFFKKIQNAGGTLNGGTNSDGTVYYEVVPKNALEMVLWMEADRMGYFINTVTESAFYNQQEVVQNEKRQRVDNRPYGHTNYVIDKNLYPEGHPYNWQVIGELEDLQNATVEDVRDFYFDFYGPNNATLVIAGDIDKKEVKALVDKYFGEIDHGKQVEPLPPMPVTLDETKKLFHEDNFARAPQFRMVFPTVEDYHKDAYALRFLGQLLSDGKKSPFYKILVKERELTSNAIAYNSSRELAGDFNIIVTANQGKTLAEVEEAIFDGFQLFEEEGITDKDMERVKASLERQFYSGISSVLGKAFQLARYNEYAGSPSFIEQDIANIQAVTKEDVMRVYDKYVKDKNYVATSFVPKGNLDLIAENSVKANVVEEEITENVEKQITKEETEIEKTPSAIDRSKEPPMGPQPEVNIPDVWTAGLANEMEVYGIEHNELPLVEFSIVIDGGLLLENQDKIGTTNLLTDLMLEGTENKTPEELEEEIDLLGSNIFMYTSSEDITVRAQTLSRNFEKTLALVEEILLEPRWDEEEFDRLKTDALNRIKRSAANPSYIASNVFKKLAFGQDHILANSTLGTEETVESITVDDLKEYYNRNFSPSIARFHVTGNITRDRVVDALAGLEENWQPKEVTFPDYPEVNQPDEANIYFVDIPDAKQSVINIGYPTFPRNHPDYYPAVVMNYKLGGSFNGNVNLVLREEKGYTYGARSRFSSSRVMGTFTASSSVRTNVTLESVEIFREEMDKYRDGISEEDLEFTKNAMIKSNTRRFETLYSLLSMIQTMSEYDLPPDYIKQEEEIIRNMTPDKHQQLAQQYIDPDRMIYLVVGDAETQLGRLDELGLGAPILVDREGNPVRETVSMEP